MKSISIAAAIMLAVLAAMAIAPRHGDAKMKMSMEEMVAAAKTRADHENLAKHYDAMAAEARAKAEMHQKMADAYRKEGGAIVSKLHFDEHCDSLVKAFKAEAEEYEALAKAEREMAKEMK